MKVFVAGASGTIGIPLVRALVAAGHEVTAMTRTPGKQTALRAIGAAPVIVDAFDADALRRAVVNARPAVVIHQLTALPKLGPTRASELTTTNRLRVEGTRNLLAAAIAAGARRFIGGSFAMLRDDADVPAGMRQAADAVRSMESQILDASKSGRIEGIVLRYGGFYAPGTPMTDDLLARGKRGRLIAIRNDQGLLPFIHLDDAVSATIAALDRGHPGGVYDIVDDRPISFSDVTRTVAEVIGGPRPRALPLSVLRLMMPYLARLFSMQLPLSNARAKAELGWRPAYPTVRDGLAARRAAAA